MACSIVAFAFTACTDVWEEHYQPNPELNADETLWELIENDPSLKKFASYLKATGYDTLLTKNRCYTVWAPVDEGFAYNETNTALWEKEFVQNHIADYSHVAGGRLSEDNKVKMLNGKYIGFENARTGKFTFKGNPLKMQNIPAKNGILHKVDGYAAFTANIWEQLAKDSSLDSLRNFLYKDYKREPNWNASVQGPVKDGQIQYLDTAWTVTCPWFNSLGRLNREDSSYTMFAPTNQAWKELYDDTERYFRYTTGFGSKGDSIRNVVIKEFMVRNLVFSDKVNKKYATGDAQYPYDSLVSNYNYAYTYEPLVFGTKEVRDLYDGLANGQSLTMSNGTLNIVDKVNYDPLLCWHDTISIEGENLVGEYNNETDNDFEGASKSVIRIDRDSLMYDSISGGAVGVYNGGNENPRLSFKLRNVLSARYEVKIVVVSPEKLSRYDTTYIKPNKFLATLTCGDSELKDALIQIPLGRKDSCAVRGRDIYSIPGRIDTITLVPLDTINWKPTGVDYVEIPTCEYNEESLLDGGDFQTRLEIVSNLGNGGKDFTYKKNYLKDKEEYIKAVRAYNAAVEAKKLKLEELENNLELSEEEKAEILEDLDEDIEDAQKDVEKGWKKIEKMDQDYGRYLDNTLRIDQVILVPVRFDE